MADLRSEGNPDDRRRERAHSAAPLPSLAPNRLTGIDLRMVVFLCDFREKLVKS